jgi:hypothetical protein
MEMIGESADILEELMSVWFDVISSIKSATAVLVIVTGIAAIVGAILFSILKLSKKNQTAAVVFPSLACCIVMIPVVTSFNNLVETAIKETAGNKNTAEMQAQIDSLNDTITLLENAQLSFQSFQKILELALLQTNLRQTDVHKTQITENQEGMGINADWYHDEALVITTHDINAKFGVDLNAVKISRVMTFLNH